jgi:hypothetical protein
MCTFAQKKMTGFYILELVVEVDACSNFVGYVQGLIYYFRRLQFLLSGY